MRPGPRGGGAGFDKFIGAEADLIRNIHGIAKAAELDGDELGYLLGKIADLKGPQQRLEIVGLFAACRIDELRYGLAQPITPAELHPQPPEFFGPDLVFGRCLVSLDPRTAAGDFLG